MYIVKFKRYWGIEYEEGKPKEMYKTDTYQTDNLEIAEVIYERLLKWNMKYAERGFELYIVSSSKNTLASVIMVRETHE